MAEDTLFGWTLDQYRVANVWVESQGKGKGEYLNNAAGDMEFFNELQALWNEAHFAPPLTGAYALYNPEPSDFLDFFLRIRWLNTRMQETSNDAR